MTEPNSRNEKPKEERRFSQEQYDMLKRCSDKNDLTEWNEWRRQRPKEPIYLEGADFLLTDRRTNRPIYPHLVNANLTKAYLSEAVFIYGDLRGAQFSESHSERTRFEHSRLEGTDFHGARLGGAVFTLARVDGGTSLWLAKVNRFTDFRGVGLDNILMEEATKQLLSYNIRWMNWEDWYWGSKERNAFKKMKMKKETLVRACRVVSRLVLTSPVRLFWLISDYGLRTWRIILWFFGLAFAFAVLYWLLPSSVMVNGTVGDIRGLWHALYFSVVTMTTLGFGDIAANPDSWLGQTLLMVQVILGYVLLGALVTRFAVLFTAGGPAGKFADDKGQTTDDG
jgi:hypothetical protein